MRKGEKVKREIGEKDKDVITISPLSPFTFSPF